MCAENTWKCCIAKEMSGMKLSWKIRLKTLWNDTIRSVVYAILGNTRIENVRYAYELKSKETA